MPNPARHPRSRRRSSSSSRSSARISARRRARWRISASPTFASSIRARAGRTKRPGRRRAAPTMFWIDGRVFATVGDAIADLGFIYATTARAREVAKPVVGPREAAARHPRARRRRASRAGVLFGRERTGLTNEELSLADEILTFPVDPAFASLNVAQAVLLFAYEWRLAGFAPGRRGLPLPTRRPVPAPKEDLIRLVRASRSRRSTGPASSGRRRSGRTWSTGAPRDAAARRLLRAGGADAARRGRGARAAADAAAGASRRDRHHRARQGRGRRMTRLLVFDSGIGGLSVVARDPARAARRGDRSMSPTMPAFPMATGRTRRSPTTSSG